MIAIDWTSLGLGLIVGALVGALFFTGLAWGIRLALRAARPAPVLLMSAALRIGVLLGVGWLIAGQGLTALAGFALAFVAARFTATAITRPSAGTEGR
ncbi:ATP synthase subunit I [Pikeienuella sp. HZG-20]|uniref:ATP synthase subunit I n=1 Tax=Paludibacillus litoralis TaxID=3133267 RepID=UPI0030EE6CC8